VTVEVAGLSPTGVTGLGEGVQVEFRGAPVQLMAVAAVNPPLGVTEMVVVVGSPWVTVEEVTPREMVKSDAAVMVTESAVEVEAEKAPVAPG
jgi:hypothetical protein